jgi:peptide deformylase
MPWGREAIIASQKRRGGATYNRRVSILKVARMGHPVLRTRARAVEPDEIASPAFQRFIDDMLDTMAEYQGIGLAAPQVHEPLRLFVAGVESDSDLPQIVVINPQVMLVGEERVEDWEGCLSIPDIRGRVPRAREVKLRALDRRGKRIELTARNYYARVIQHETDHLDGVLFFDRMTSLESLAFLDEYSRYWAPADDVES